MVLFITGMPYALSQDIISPVQNEKTKPNILLIVADDLGYTDLGAYGGEIKTTNLDALAASGVKLTNFHTAPACSPTRASLLTGVEHHLAGLGTMHQEWDENQLGQPGYEGFLNSSVVTIAELLKNSGYMTYMAGKWHLGKSSEQTPDARGFEQSFALLEGGASHFSDQAGLAESASVTYQENGHVVDLPDDFYSSKYYTDKLIEYIGEGKALKKPFFAFAAYTAPHWPLQVPNDYLELYAGKYDQGYSQLRRSRIARMKQIGLIEQSFKLNDDEAEAAWNSLNPQQKKIASKQMEIYAAMVEYLDEQVGRLIDHLRDINQLDNTVIIFMSDNGAEGNDISHLSNNKEWLPKAFDNSLKNMGKENSYVFTGPYWAQASVGPFRLFKGFSSEGGIRAPAIISYQGLTPIKQQTEQFISVLEIAPTILDLAGVTHPGTLYQGRKIHPASGKSLVPYLTGQETSVLQNVPIGTELFGRRAITRDNWKLVWMCQPYGEGRWQLFDLSKDLQELHDLSSKHTSIVSSLLKSWESYVNDNGIILPQSGDSGYAKSPEIAKQACSKL